MGSWLMERECVGVVGVGAVSGRSRLALCPCAEACGLGRLGAVGRAGLAKLNSGVASGSSTVSGGPVVGEDMRWTKSSKGEPDCEDWDKGTFPWLEESKLALSGISGGPAGEERKSEKSSSS